MKKTCVVFDIAIPFSIILNKTVIVTPRVSNLIAKSGMTKYVTVSATNSKGVLYFRKNSLNGTSGWEYVLEKESGSKK